MSRFLLVLLLAGCGTLPSQDGGVRLALFVSDVTPPKGHPLCGGWIKPVGEVVQPLQLRGMILEDGATRCLIAAMDWCVLRGAAYDRIRSELARAAGIEPAFVALHLTHTHSAPIADLRAEELMAATSKPLKHLDIEWFGRITSQAGAAVREALTRWQPVTQVGFGQAKVERFASSRRVVGPDGKIRVRYSSTKDAFLREAPEGAIDPWLKTVTFYDGEAPRVRMHYYASHPQSFYGDGTVHPDTPGLARSYLEQEEGVPQLYFTGCGGDVTAGKYNDGSPAARFELSKQLYAGMIRASAASRRAPLPKLDWKFIAVVLPPRQEAEHAEAAYRKVMEDPAAAATPRLTAALAVAWQERLRTRPGVELSRLRLGPVDLLHLPGEPFVEYQLFAQSRRPERFIAVAGYGEGGPGYVCTDAAIGEGGYEPTQSLVGPPTESVLKTAIETLLK